MRATAIHAGRPRRHHRRRASRRVVWSLAMIPALLPTFAVAELAGSAAQSLLGLAENQMLTEAGALGVLALVVLTLLLLVPSLVGVALALRARRRGERGLATVALAANGFVLAAILLPTILNAALV